MSKAIDHLSRLEWNRKGECLYEVRRRVKCDGGKYGNGHEESYTDEYGTYHSCEGCGGSGIVLRTKHIRVPEFDAPKPKPGWEPDWIEG